MMYAYIDAFNEALIRYVILSGEVALAVVPFVALPYLLILLMRRRAGR